MNDGLTSGFGKAPSAAIVLAKAGSVTFPGFSFVGDKDTGLWNPTGNSLAFAVGGIEMMRMTAAQQVLMGTPTALVTRLGVSNISPRLQAAATTGTLSSMGQFVYNVSGTAAPYTLHAKSRNSAVGGHAIVADGDLLGAYSAAGSDGVQFGEAARIEVRVDAAPGVGAMPGRLVFYTTPAASVIPVEAMRIDSTQGTTFVGNVAVNGGLTVAGNATVSSALLIAGASGAIQFASGTSVGGAVTQNTNKATLVTINKVVGKITMNAASLAADAKVFFAMQNFLIQPNSLCVVTIVGGVATPGSYGCRVLEQNGTSVFIELENRTGGALAEAVQIQYWLINGAQD